MTKKPIVITAAVLAAAAGGGGFAIAATGGNGVGELDADLVGGDTLVMTVEAKDADRVQVTYGGTTQTAERQPADDDDGDDEDRDYVTRFPAAAGDRTAGAEVSVKAAVTSGGDTKTATLTDRLDVEDEAEDDFEAVEPETREATPATPTAAKPRVGDLDADLVRGDTLVLTVEARDAKTVKLRYAGTTRTATADRDDAGDRERDFTVRLPAGDARTNGQRITVQATATGERGTTTRTLVDRLDAD